MDSVFAFIKSASPWIAMGLLVVILAVLYSERKKKDGDDEPGNYAAEGMCLGMCFGTALGSAIGDNNTGIGISLGMLIGLAAGTCIKKKPKKDSDE